MHVNVYTYHVWIQSGLVPRNFEEVLTTWLRWGLLSTGAYWLRPSFSGRWRGRGDGRGLHCRRGVGGHLTCREDKNNLAQQSR